MMFYHSTEQTQIESALLELEMVGAEDSAGEKVRNLLVSRLSELGIKVPVSMTREQGLVKLRALLPGPKAADFVYHIETQVTLAYLLHSRALNNLVNYTFRARENLTEKMYTA